MVTINRIYDGCDTLDAVGANDNQAYWKKHDATATLHIKKNKLTVSRASELLSIQLPPDAESVDIYLPPMGNTSAPVVARAGATAPAAWRTQCEPAPATAKSTAPLRDAGQAVTTPVVPSAAPPPAAPARDSLQHVRALLEHWGTIFLQKPIRAGFYREHGATSLIAEMRVPVTSLESFGRLLAGLLSRAGAGSGLVLVAADDACCSTIQSMLPETHGVVCHAQPALPPDTVLLAMVPGPDPDGQILQAQAARLHADADSVRELLGMLHGDRTLDGAYRGSAVQRIIYGACDELQPVRGASAIREWAHAQGMVRVRPGPVAETLLVARGDTAAILKLPSDAAVDLYLDPVLDFDPATHVFSARLSADRQRLARQLDARYECTLPASPAEQSAQRRARDLPTFTLSAAFFGGYNSALHANQRDLTSGATTTVTLSLEAACDPEQLQFDCPDIGEHTGMIPKITDAGSWTPPNQIGYLLNADFNVWRGPWYQLTLGAELAVTNHSLVGDTPLPTELYLPSITDFNVRIGFRHTLLKFGNHAFLSGVSGGGGLSRGGYNFEGSNLAAELVWWRMTKELWFLEVFGRISTHRLSGDHGNSPYAADPTAHATLKLDNSGESTLGGLRMGLSFGAPDPVAIPDPQPMLVLQGELIATRPIGLNLDLLDDARTTQWLAVNDVQSLVAQPGLFTAPMQHHPDLALNALLEVAHGLRFVPKGHQLQLIVTADSNHLNEASAADRLHRAENAARVVRHLLVLLGVPPQQLVIAPWTSTQLHRYLAKFEHTDPDATPYIDSLALSDGQLFFTVMAPIRY